MSTNFHGPEGTADDADHRARYPHAPALIDGRTGLVIDDTEDSCDHSQKTLASGFGPAVKLLEVESFRLAPWMTPELAEQEIAMQGTKGS